MIALLLACAAPAGLRFDGVDDLARVEGVDGLDGAALTVEVWFTAEPGADKANLLARRAAGGRDSFLLRVKAPGPTLELGLGDGGREWGTLGRTPIPLGRRTMAAATHDRRSGMVRLYLDGSPDGEARALAPAATGADLPLWIGGDPRHGPTGRPFRGVIHAVRLWDVVRTPDEVRADAASPAPAGTPGLRWAWDGAADGVGLGLTDGPDASDPTLAR